MSKILIIAEKPSVARDIASVLKVPKEKDWFESSTVLVSSAIGHLLEIGVEEEDGDRFDMSKIPVIPENFKLLPVKKTMSQLKLLKSLIDRKDVSCIVNACDAGREGELIFRYIYLHSRSKKDTKRMWLQSMTSEAIKDSFAKMQPGSKYDNLFQAAISRSEADWLVGINGSRVLSLRNKELTGGWSNYTVGRVQTPTLAILVDRELAIKSFVPRDFWEVHGTFGVGSGDYGGKWFDPAWKKDEDQPEREAHRIFDLKLAENIVKRCKAGKLVEVSEETTPTKRAPPKLYDLTTLQREANTRFGLSAKKTLGIAQALYETHKVCTYPRTDSSYLPTDYVAKAKETVRDLGAQAGYAPFSGEILKEGWVKPLKSVFDDSKISDHFAIIPTGTVPRGLDPDESKIYDMVAKRFLAVFYPAAAYLQTKRVTIIDQTDHFSSSGKVLTEPGWLAVYGKALDEDGGDAVLCAIKKGETPKIKEIKQVALETKPPSRYTEATLLGAMERAGKLVADEHMAEAMKERGLGTPATRAAIIEGLLSDDKGYCKRDKKELVPTEKGISLVIKLRDLPVAVLTQPALTGDWEYTLKQMEAGKVTRAAFKAEIVSMVKDLVTKVKSDSTPIKGEKSMTGSKLGEPLGTSCPDCGNDLLISDKTCNCSSCTFKVWREVAGKKISESQMKKLMAGDTVGPIKGFTSKAGKKFDASLVWKDGKISFDFGGDSTGSSAPREKSSVEITCPKCSASDMTDDGKKISCACGFSFWKTMAGREFSPSEMSQLFLKKETEVLDGFTAKSGSKFSAKVVLEGEKASFKFEDKPRAEASGPALKGKCPACKGEIKETDKTFACTGCSFKIWKTMAGREFTKPEVESLLQDKESEKFSGFISKAGKPFSAKVRLTKTGTEFAFEP